MSPLTLRRVEAVTHARAQWVQRWRHAGHPAGLGRPTGQPGYLGFCAVGSGGEWRGLINAFDWLHHAWPSLREWLPRECPASSIACLFRAVPQPLLLPEAVLPYRELLDVELIDVPALPSEDLPWLDTALGRIWVTQLPTVRAINPLEAPWLQDLPLRLELLLGCCQLSHGSRARLGPGDVLRITHRTDHCRLANRCIGIFTFTQGGLHMQSTLDDERLATPVELASVPVRLEFLLASQDIALGTLAQIMEGHLIPLPSDAERQIEVRANGMPVARGELVQLDGQLGVEVLELVARNRRDE